MQRALLICGCLAALALAALVVGAYGTRAALELHVAACTGPVVHDRYDGFHIGVPNGWFLSSSGGLIVVEKDYPGTNEGVVETALLGKSQTAAEYLTVAAASLTKSAAAAGNALAFRITTKSGLAQATVTGRAGSTVIAGQAGVRLLPVHTAHGSQLAVFSGYWAPPSELGSERTELASIGACYGSDPATLFRLFKDSAFTYPLPPGWKVGGEGQDSIYLDDGQSGSANFILAGPFLASTTGVTDDKSLVTYNLQHLGISISTVLATASAPNAQTATGGTEQEELIEFLGTSAGKRVHGLVRVISSTGGGVTSGALRIVLAKPQLWNSLNGGLLWVAYGIQHDFTQDLTAILHAQQQLAGFAQQVSGFDQALNGTDLVSDPATGITYEAPYSAYRQSGPDGPGYYTASTGSLTKLNIVTP